MNKTADSTLQANHHDAKQLVQELFDLAKVTPQVEWLAW